MSTPFPFVQANNRDDFDAVLRDTTGKIFETGYGSITQENDAVDFVADFVPLMELNSTAEIVKIIDGQECHKFVGKVYLSAKTRLQIRSVQETLLTNQELLLPFAVDVPAVAHVIQFIPAPVNRFGRKKLGAKDKHIVRTEQVNVFSVSADEIWFTAPKEYPIETQLLMNVNDPLRMQDVELSVYKRLDFSSEHNAYYAKIQAAPAGSRKMLTDFLSSKILVFQR